MSHFINEPIVIERERPSVTPPFTRIVVTSCVHKAYKLEVTPSEKSVNAITFRLHGINNSPYESIALNVSLDNAVEIARELLRYAEAVRDAKLGHCDG